MRRLTGADLFSCALLAATLALAPACSSGGGGGEGGSGGSGTSTGGRGSGTGARGGSSGGANATGGSNTSTGGQPGGAGGSGTGGSGTSTGGTGGGPTSTGGQDASATPDAPASDTPAPPSDAPTAPPPGKCDYAPKANATALKLRFQTVALTGVTTSDIVKATGSKDGITEMKFVPGRPGELLLLQKRGKINHMKLAADASSATLVKAFDIPVFTGNDCGLISMAFDPDFASNKLIYVGFCTTASASKLVRYKWDADALTDPVDIMTWSAGSGPGYHAIGSMGFDAQGAMWILHGEFYTSSNAQNLNTNLGKLLRIIPSRAPGQGGYMPAADNPFAADAKPRSAIYAWGLRSPWRGILTGKGHWVVGDVQDQMNEEVNVVTGMGQNFGWPGSSGACTGMCSTPITYYRGARDPYEGQGNEVKEGRQGRAVWVGAQYGDCGNDRYRGALTGVVLFGDFYAGWVRGLVLDDAGKMTKDVNMGELGTVSSMAQHEDGHLFVTTLGPYGTAAGERAGLWRALPE
jgi:glucose/arabinose dehydrogenase